MPATRKQRRKTKRVLHEYKHGQLKSGGRRKVKSRKQAIAIAMSESGQSGNRRKTAAKRKSSGTRAPRKKAAKRKSGSRSRTRKKAQS